MGKQTPKPTSSTPRSVQGWKSKRCLDACMGQHIAQTMGQLLGKAMELHQPQPHLFLIFTSPLVSSPAQHMVGLSICPAPGPREAPRLWVGSERADLRRKTLLGKGSKLPTQKLTLSSFQEADGPALVVLLTPFLWGQSWENSAKAPRPHLSPPPFQGSPGWASLPAAGNP